MTLSQRTSGKGTRYLSGWLGKASLVAFLGEELDRFGNPVWNVYAAELQPREDGVGQAAVSASSGRVPGHSEPVPVTARGLR